MPSGPKKRHAARRRSLGRPGARPPPDGGVADKASVSGSQVSDEGVVADGRSVRLSLATGTDQTFQTEEWVRVSDFDVGTPTSTAAKGEFDVGDARAHDKLAEWESVSQENAGNSSSAEEAGESSRRKPDLKLPHVDVVLLGSDSEKEESVSSRSGKSSRSSARSSSTSDAYPKKSSDEERSSSIVVVPSYREREVDSQESSYVEVGSVGAREDEYHGSVTNLSSPDGKDAIEPASSEEHEEESYEVFSGVEDHAIEPASSDEQDEGKYQLFRDLSNVKDLVDERSGSNAVDLSSLIRGDEEPASKSSHEVEPHPSPDEEDDIVAEESTLIEPTTPEKTSEKSFADSPYTFVRAVSDEEILKSSPSEVEEPAPTPSEENVAKEAHDSSVSRGMPEPDREQLEELLGIAHSKEIAALGKQEERILAQEEQELGKVVVEPQPLVEVMSATEPSQPMEGGDVKEELRPEESPLLKVSSSADDSDVHTATEKEKDFHPVEAEEASPPKEFSSFRDASSPVDPDVHNTSDEVKGTSPGVSEEAPLKDSSFSLVDPDFSTGKTAGSSEKHEQVIYQRREDQPRVLGPIQISSDTWGCCEPVQWLFANFRRSLNPQAIRN